MFLWFSARQRQLWEACGMDSPTLRRTLYQEKKNLPLRDRVDWTGQRIELRGDKQAATAPLAFETGRKLVA